VESQTLFPGLILYALRILNKTFKLLMDEPFRLTDISYWVLLQTFFPKPTHIGDGEENDNEISSECTVTHLRLSCASRLLPSVSTINNLINKLRNGNKLE
jgi:hypothetical protein